MEDQSQEGDDLLGRGGVLFPNVQWAASKDAMPPSWPIELHRNPAKVGFRVAEGRKKRIRRQWHRDYLPISNR
ncbi:MAG: hypothetical protein WAO58_12825 [Fimbriimonadaceae bacterium]